MTDRRFRELVAEMDRILRESERDANPQSLASQPRRRSAAITRMYATKICTLAEAFAFLERLQSEEAA